MFYFVVKEKINSSLKRNNRLGFTFHMNALSDHFLSYNAIDENNSDNLNLTSIDNVFTETKIECHKNWNKKQEKLE